MLVCVDLDGCADAYPRQLQSTMSALRAAGHIVHILTGVSAPTLGQEDLETKAQYLASIGMEAAYDELVLIPGPEAAIPQRKALYLRAHGADVLIDNSMANARAATAAGVLTLVPWGSRED